MCKISLLVSTFNPQNTIPLCTRQQLGPGLDPLWNTSPVPPPGFLFRSSVNLTGRTALEYSAGTKKGSKLETRRNSQTKRERRVLLSAALSPAHCFQSLPFCPSSELTHTLEGLPPNWSSRRSPVFSYWPLCLTANSNNQSNNS